MLRLQERKFETQERDFQSAVSNMRRVGRKSSPLGRTRAAVVRKFRPSGALRQPAVALSPPTAATRPTTGPLLPTVTVMRGTTAAVLRTIAVRRQTSVRFPLNFGICLEFRICILAFLPPPPSARTAVLSLILPPSAFLPHLF